MADKKYYSSNDIKRLTGLTSKDLHTYQKKGLIRASGKSTSHKLFFSQEMYERLDVISVLKCLKIKPSNMRMALDRYNANPKEFIDTQIAILSEDRNSQEVVSVLRKHKEAGLNRIVKSSLVKNVREESMDKFRTEKMRQWLKTVQNRYDYSDMFWGMVEACKDYNNTLNEPTEYTSEDVVRSITSYVKNNYGYFGMLMLIFFPLLMEEEPELKKNLSEFVDVDMKLIISMIVADYKNWIYEEYYDSFSTVINQLEDVYYLPLSDPKSLDFEERVCDLLFAILGVDNSDYGELYDVFLDDIFEMLSCRQKKIFKPNGWEKISYIYKVVKFYRIEGGPQWMRNLRNDKEDI